jgi:DNA-binding MarR family transcriptional regulator
MTDFIKSHGIVFMAHLLRRLSDEFVRDIEVWYREVGVRAPPRTHSTLLALSEHGPLGVTEIAALLRQSHPLVIKWIRRLKELGFVEANGDLSDRRRTVISLTDAGRADLLAQDAADPILVQAFQRLMKKADAEVFEGLWRLEEECRNEPFLDVLRKVQTDTELQSTPKEE